MTTEILLNNLAYAIFFIMGDYLLIFLGLGILAIFFSILISVLLTK